MPDVSIDVKKTVPAKTAAPDVWQSFRSEMDRVFDRFSDAVGFGFPSLRRAFDVGRPWRYESGVSFAAPAIDVAEDDKTFTITAELPGMTEKDIDISVSGDILTIKGEKEQKKEEKDKNYYVSERSYGAFQRSLALPDSVERDKIAARLDKGVLTVSLPKRAEAQKPTKKIAVKAA